MNSDNSDYIIFIKTIHSQRCNIPSIICFANVNILKNWKKNNLFDKINFTTSPISYSKNYIIFI